MHLYELREHLEKSFRERGLRHTHYADAVISLIGLNPLPEVLKAASQGDLSQAHLHQIRSHRVPDPEREPFVGWDSEPPKVPSWFERPIPPIPGKLPKLAPRVTLTRRPNGTATGSVVFFGHVKGQEVMAGMADFSIVQVENKRTMVIRLLEQKTKGVPARLSRPLEGWKNAAMRYLLNAARSHNCKAVLFNTAEEPSRSNNTDRPIHVELLETYGRLPMQHGFKLHVVQQKKDEIKRGHESGAAGLWWIKALKR